MNETTHNGPTVVLRLAYWEVQFDYWLVYLDDALVDYTGAMVWP